MTSTTVTIITCDADVCYSHTREIPSGTGYHHHFRLNADIHGNCNVPGNTVRGEDISNHAIIFRKA